MRDKQISLPAPEKCLRKIVCVPCVGDVAVVITDDFVRIPLRRLGTASFRLNRNNNKFETLVTVFFLKLFPFRNRCVARLAPGCIKIDRNQLYTWLFKLVGNRILVELVPSRKCAKNREKQKENGDFSHEILEIKGAKINAKHNKERAENGKVFGEKLQRLSWFNGKISCEHYFDTVSVFKLHTLFQNLNDFIFRELVIA